MPRTPVRRTKIVATLGPAWDEPAQMVALIDAGVNVVRINASHGTPGIRTRWIQQLRELKSQKGMNLPGIEVSAPALTEKDLEDVAHVSAVGVDYVALSFVRRPEDMEQLRALVPRSTKLVAKIEKDTALRNLCGILDVS